MARKTSNKNIISKKTILLFALILFSIFLTTTTYAARDFIVENRTAALFVVNGTTGNIFMRGTG